MNEICRKYNVSETDYKRMLNDGVLTTTVARWTEIYECFKRYSSTMQKEDAIKATMDETRACRTVVYEAVKRFNS